MTQTDETNWQFYRVAQGLLIHKNQVLLVGNDYGYPDLLWSLPGGRLEPGEQHQAAIKREFLEETGLGIVPGDLLYVVDSRSEMLHKHFVTLVFEVRLTQPESEPALVGEVDGPVKDLRFVPFAEIPELIQRPSMGEGLLNYLYYGAVTHRYWFYPEYMTSEFQPLKWPPLGSNG